MEPPALGALDEVLAAASETAMVLRPLRQENVLTVAAAAPTVPVTAGVASPVPVTAAAEAVGAAPRPLRRNVVVVAMAKTPLLGRPSAASKSAFLFPLLVGMVTRINAELLMLAQKQKNEGMVM
jgi:hypothetical protein